VLENGEALAKEGGGTMAPVKGLVSLAKEGGGTNIKTTAIITVE
jgi:hypothetical protein